jgi:hypothetical protein
MTAGSCLIEFNLNIKFMNAKKSFNFCSLFIPFLVEISTVFLKLNLKYNCYQIFIITTSQVEIPLTSKMNLFFLCDLSLRSKHPKAQQTFAVIKFNVEKFHLLCFCGVVFVEEVKKRNLENIKGLRERNVNAML